MTRDPGHHRASLLTNIRYWQREVRFRRPPIHHQAWMTEREKIENRIRRDLIELNGMAGKW